MDLWDSPFQQETMEEDDANNAVGNRKKTKHSRRTMNQAREEFTGNGTPSVEVSHKKHDSSSGKNKNDGALSQASDHNANQDGSMAISSIEGEHSQDIATDDGEPAPLHKSSRLKGYMTLALASFINFDAADNSSGGGIGVHVSVVTSSPKQRGFAVAVSVVSLAISTVCFIIHLDRFSPLNKFWRTMFKPKSKFEGLVIAFLTIWWTLAAGVNTSVRGPAGDGRGQFSLYYSCWVCCFTCYWMAERWWVAAGLSSFKSFIDSWPNRSPAWICLLILSLTTFVSLWSDVYCTNQHKQIWYLDLWQNHKKLTRPSEALILSHFETVARRQWQWLVIVTIATFCPSIVFVLIELFRGTNPDGTITSKTKGEVIIEGCCFFTLALAWIPTVMIATTPRGAASLIGNAYFCTWINTIAVCEGLVWFIHDKRRETHELLQRKKQAYIRRQERVLEETLDIQHRGEQKQAGDESSERTEMPENSTVDPMARDMDDKDDPSVGFVEI